MSRPLPRPVPAKKTRAAVEFEAGMRSYMLGGRLLPTMPAPWRRGWVKAAREAAKENDDKRVTNHG